MSNSGNAKFCIIAIMLLIVPIKSAVSAQDQPANSITIVYNNISGDTTSGVQVGGGFSAFILFKGHTILFDVGGDASILVNNINALNLELAKLDAVVISHNHWDHVYGLPGIYSLLESNPKVYVTGSSKDAVKQQYPGADVVPVEEPVEICPCVWSTGAIATEYHEIPISEQSLILNDDDGLYVITGCSHPGIVNIIERIREFFPEKPIALVAGGFHLVNTSDVEIRAISKMLRELGVRNIAPSHCTGRSAMEIFEKEWRDGYIRLCLGDTQRL